MNGLKDIKNMKAGECFHGEVWMICPHCGSGIEIMSQKPLYKQDGFYIYKCDQCGHLMKDK